MDHFLCIALVMALVSPICPKCVNDPKSREVQFEVCPADKVNPSGHMGDQVAVSSPMFCSLECMSNPSCVSYNTKMGSSIICQMSTVRANCSNLSDEPGSRTYVMQPETDAESVGCSNPWRLALKTNLGVTAQGSVADLRSAILDGAKVHAELESYPFPTYSSDYRGWLYVLDTVEVTETDVIGYAYHFDMSDPNIPVWKYVTIYNSGEADWVFVNGTSKHLTGLTVTWLVQDPYTDCYLPVLLSHKNPIGAPAVTIIGNENGLRDDETTDLRTTVSETFITIRAVRSLLDQSYSTFRLYGFVYDEVSETLKATATWIPSGEMDLLTLDYDFGRVPVETYAHLSTSDENFMDGFSSDPNLNTTQLFFDPCWSLDYAVYSDLRIEGDAATLISNVENGAALGIYVSNSTSSVIVLAEYIEISTTDTYLRASAEMGITLNQGASWVPVVVSTSGELEIDNVSPLETYHIRFFTDRRQRSYTCTVTYGVVQEGSFDGVRVRLAAGLLPRMMIIYPDTESSFYFEVEHAEIYYDQDYVALQSHRTTISGGYHIFHVYLSLDSVWASGFTKSFTSPQYPETNYLDTLRLFFEDSTSIDFGKFDNLVDDSLDYGSGLGE